MYQLLFHQPSDIQIKQIVDMYTTVTISGFKYYFVKQF